jgi:hypothetical protein
VDGEIIVLLVEDDEEPLRVFVTPNLEELVDKDDQPYVDALLADFLKRSKAHAEGLFQQVSSLSVGPMVTHRTGILPADRDYLKIHCPDFLPLSVATD